MAQDTVLDEYILVSPFSLTTSFLRSAFGAASGREVPQLRSIPAFPVPRRREAQGSSGLLLLARSILPEGRERAARRWSSHNQPSLPNVRHRNKRKVAFSGR